MKEEVRATLKVEEEATKGRLTKALKIDCTDTTWRLERLFLDSEVTTFMANMIAKMMSRT